MPKSKSYIGIKNEAETSTLELHFTDFIYDGFNWDTWETTNLVQETINKIKAANPSKIKVVINSLGGDVMIGLALYNYIKAYKAEKEVDVLGFAASIASIMAMVADPGKLRMGKSTFMIIHAAWSYAAGNAKEMRKQADDLDKVTNELAGIYAQRSGKEASYFTDLWADGDYWMTATEAKEIGLADEIYNSEPVNAKVDFSNYDFKNVPTSLLKNEAVPADNKTFLSQLNNQFMKIIDDLKAAIGAGKKDDKFKNVVNKDEILDMVEQVLTPIVNKIDAALEEETEQKPTEEKPAETAPATEAKPTEEKPTETKPATEKPAEEKPAETKPEASQDLKDINARLLKMEKENKELRDALANKNTKPENANGKSASGGFNKAKVEYAD
jgi:ATP-dependent Clp protease protease subunit